MKLKTAYDIAVVGGGPAGSMAALEASKAGLSVCLLEKTSRIGSKVRCGEAMSVNALKYFFEIKEEWVSREISYCNINSPSGIKLKTKFSSDKCIILNRDIFTYWLDIVLKGNETPDELAQIEKFLNIIKVILIVATSRGKILL